MTSHFKIKPYIKFFFEKWACVKNAKNEDAICIDICNNLRNLILKNQFNGLFFHVENEGSYGRSHQLNLLRKACGKISGVGDYIFLRDGECLVIEIKTEKGEQQESQKHFESWCNDYNVPYYICRSWHEVSIKLKEYGFIK